MPIIQNLYGDLIKEFLNPKGMIFHMAHGANCQGVMGSGIAVDVRERIPDAYEHYLKSPMTPGSYSVGSSPYDPMMKCFNLYTQVLPGRNASLNLIGEAFSALDENENEIHGKNLGIPLIGCGVGGLKWEDVYPIINRVTPNLKIILFRFQPTN